MSGTCEHSDVCGRDALDGHDGKCILHSEDPDKDEEAFEKALKKHWEEHGPDFRGMVFPEEVDFKGATFDEEANFENAIFRSRSSSGKFSFAEATFKGPAIFRDVSSKDASFYDSTFKDTAYFANATFGKVTFSDATFEKGAFFNVALRCGEHIEFDEAKFYRCKFRGEAEFTGKNESERAFADGKVDFRDVAVAPDASLLFRHADLSRCHFLRTDLRDVEFTGVKWCDEISVNRWFTLDWFRGKEWFRRVGLYEEIHELNEDDSLSWPEIERLHRQLKRNYENRGDFPRAGDFHIGEKEARRRNPQTHWGIQFLLTVYRALSMYGERALPAALWLVVLVFGFALVYYLSGATTLATVGPVTYPEALIHSLEATFYPVRSVGFRSFGPQFFSIVQRVISPVLIALLALALRQRVKR